MGKDAGGYFNVSLSFLKQNIWDVFQWMFFTLKTLRINLFFIVTFQSKHPEIIIV